MNMEVNKSCLRIACYLLFITELQCRPQSTLITTTPRSSSVVLDPSSSKDPQPPPKIVDIDIRTDIQFRYAKTVVRTYIKNPSITKSQEVKFHMVLPNTAFISNFTIQLNGEEKIYVAKVEEKEEAKNSYSEAVARGQSAGLVDAETRDASQITVSSNLEATGKMVFTLTYEELLERHNSKYEHIIHVNPGKIVPTYNVNIYINESLPVTHLNVPELKVNPNEITSQLSTNKVAHIARNVDNNPNKVHIHFSPTSKDQRRMAKLSTNEESGMSGQFIVQYDVDRKNQTNEIQILDGYFVHFFAPEKLDVLPKHVVFVLDVSGSMQGTKMQQTKDAMLTILDDMSDQDYFNILTFSDDVYHWKPKILQPTINNNSDVIMETLTHKGTSVIRKEAIKYVLDLETIGGTNINDGLKEALKVIKTVRLSEAIPSNVKPIVIFLTDGEATTGVTDSEAIRNNVLTSNENLKVPIYGLAFGEGADFGLIKDISTENEAFARRVYEASDAPIQLEDFYQEIANPLLSNVTFEYVGESFRNKTNKKFTTFFKGGEYVIAGKLDDTVGDGGVEIIVRGVGKSTDYKEIITPCIYYNTNYTNNDECCDEFDYCEFSPHNCAQYIPNRHVDCIPWPIPPTILPSPTFPTAKDTKSDAENFIERLWAFLTIQNLLDKIESKDSEQDWAIEEESDKEKALTMALQYNFVTELTSLVVVKPGEVAGNEYNSSNGVVVNFQPLDVPRAVPLSYSSYSSIGHIFGGNPLSSPIYTSGGSIRIVAKSGSIDYEFSDDELSREYGSHYDMAEDSYSYDSYDYDSYSYASSGSGGALSVTDENDLRSVIEGPEINEILPQQSLNSIPAKCSITLFNQTFLRGDDVTLMNPNNATISDLSVYSFDNKLVSFEVIGPCCWRIFKDKSFGGYNKKFSEGKYKSSTSLGAELVKEASSVMTTDC